MRLIILVMGLTFLVDLLLLFGTNRLLSYPPGWWRVILAALVDSLFSGLCLVDRFRFLGRGMWRILVLAIMVSTAFGVGKNAARRGLIFLLLKFALHGFAGLMDDGGILPAILGAGGIAALCAKGLPAALGESQFVPVELKVNDRLWKMTAFRDTGNSLRDPLTGERVLVAGADIGQKLLGLTAGQLSDPADTLAAGLAPGMRLIPYRTVGQRGAMMLARRFKEVKIGSWQGSALVAFAPDCFGKNDGFQMLIGG